MKNRLYFPHLLFLLVFFFLFPNRSTAFTQQNRQQQVAPNKSILTITSPVVSTVWKMSNTISIEWTTTNIGPEKNIRFFLVRDEMVEQELGIFPNTGAAHKIKLAKNIGPGDTYQVMGIELFPDDKYNIAKFVTPLFTITKENKNLANTPKQPLTSQVQNLENSALSKNDKRQLKKQQKKAEKLAKNKGTKQTVPNTAKLKHARSTSTQKQVPKAPKLREEFVGRNITYVNDLALESTEISVYIWDHGRQDGDIVSIYLNGEPVLTKYYLTYWKKEIKITLDPTKKNDLFLYAHNLGSAPPNTVSLKITDGTTTTEDIVLNSDLKSCEAVSISVTK